MEQGRFKHMTEVRVRNFEVDWQGIVHNAVYLQYFEIGRIEYLKRLGIKIDIGSVRSETQVVLVRNDILYKSPARFDELLNVFSRISYIKNTSFAFEGYLEERGSGRLVAENTAIHVWLHHRTGEPVTVPDSFRKAVLQFEGGDVGFLGPTLLT